MAGGGKKPVWIPSSGSPFRDAPEKDSTSMAKCGTATGIIADTGKEMALGMEFFVLNEHAMITFMAYYVDENT